MIEKVISKMLEDGWTYDMISAKTGISIDKLKKHGELSETQENSLLRVAAVEARIDLDECFGGEE